MIFELGSLLVELEAPAQYPHDAGTTLIQARDTSASGVPHIESFEVQTDKSTYVFVDMSQSDYVAVLEWFVNTAEGMLNSFDLTDDLGVTTEVRFTSPEIRFKKNSYGLWSGSFTVESV
jgi:hypothetical protein